MERVDMKLFVVGLNLVDRVSGEASAADMGVAPPEQLQSQSETKTHGETWSARSAGEENALHKYKLDTFLVYSPDAGVAKAMKPADLFTFVHNNKIEGVTENAVKESAGQISLDDLNFTALPLYKMPCYHDGVLIENPKRFVLGSAGNYYLAYDPQVGDIEFYTKEELVEVTKQTKGRPWTPLSAEKLTLNRIPKRLKQKFMSKYASDKARESELGDMMVARKTKEEAEKELEKAKKVLEKAEETGDENKIELARGIVAALEQQQKDLEEEAKQSEEAYENASGREGDLTEDEIDDSVNMENIKMGAKFELVDDKMLTIAPHTGSSLEDTISMFGNISLKPRGVLKTVTQLLKEHEGELDEIYASIDEHIEEDKAFGASLTFRATMYPAEDSSFEESALSISLSRAGLPVRDAIIAGADALKTIDPYLWCVYSALKIIPVGPEDKNALTCRTLGVTQTKMYYNTEFVKTLTLSELSFIMLHEMYHVIMKHPIRGKTYDPSLWNIILDLFVNGTIAKNYGLDLNHKTVEHVCERKGKSTTLRLTLPDSALYDPALDVTATIPEQMYVEMMQELQELKRQLQNQSQNNQNGQGQGQGSSGSGQSQGQNQGQGQGQGNQNGQGGGQGQGNSMGQNSGKNSGNQNGNGQGQGNGQGGNSQGNGPTNSGNRPIITDVKTDANGHVTSVTIKMSNGQKKTVPVGQNEDVFVDPGTLLDNDDNNGQGINGVLERATQSARTAGLGDSSPAFRLVTNMVDVKDKNWEKFLEKYLRECHKTSKAYRRPNRKMMNYGFTMKGKVPADPDSLKGVYVCIDTSGSISDTDLNEMLGIIKATLKKYQITGHVLYWDTNVAAIGEFHDERSLVAARRLAAGGGGTDPECVFRYLKSNACKEKANLVIMVTDGYFGRNIKKENPKMFGDVLWLITTGREDYLRFEPPFGKKAPLGFHWGKKQ